MAEVAKAADLTIQEAADKLGTTTRAVYYWHGRAGFKKWKTGKRLMNMGRAGVRKISLRVLTPPQFKKIAALKSRTGDAIPEGRISREDALLRYPFLKPHQLHTYRRAKADDHRSKRNGKITRGKSPLGAPLTVEFYKVPGPGGLIARPYFLIGELDSLRKIVLGVLGIYVENGIEYRSTSKLAADHELSEPTVTNLAIWLPDELRGDYRPIRRKIPSLAKGGSIGTRKSDLWPADLAEQAVQNIRAAKKEGWSGRGPVPTAIRLKLPTRHSRPGHNGTPATSSGQAAAVGQVAGAGRGVGPKKCYTSNPDRFNRNGWLVDHRLEEPEATRRELVADLKRHKLENPSLKWSIITNLQNLDREMSLHSKHIGITLPRRKAGNRPK